jgi:aspartate racemase
MHIGLIGGIGPAATDYYYRGPIEGHVAARRLLELTMAHADVRELVANLGADRRDLPRPRCS